MGSPKLQIAIHLPAFTSGINVPHKIEEKHLFPQRTYYHIWLFSSEGKIMKKLCSSWVTILTHTTSQGTLRLLNLHALKNTGEQTSQAEETHNKGMQTTGPRGLSAGSEPVLPGPRFPPMRETGQTLTPSEQKTWLKTCHLSTPHQPQCCREWHLHVECSEPTKARPIVSKCATPKSPRPARCVGGV